MANKKRQTASDSKKQSGQPTKSGKRLTEKRTMLSIRLNERERTLLTEAASIREQSATGFIKSAAISRAAHVVNTSKKTTFDFVAVAETVATLLFTKEFDREYRGKYLTAEGYPALGWEALTQGEIIEEQNEWDGAGGTNTGTACPERWLELNTENWVKEHKGPGPGDDVIWLETRYEQPEAPVIRDNRVPLTKEDFLRIQRAARLGGTEFLQCVLQIGAKMYCEDEDLDEPIDPEIID